MKKITGLLLAACCAMMLGGCGENEFTAPELMEPVGVKLDTATVERGEIYNLSVFNGAVVPYVEGLSFESDGTLKQMAVSLGDKVTKGAVLAVLNKDKETQRLEDLEEEIASLQKNGQFTDKQALCGIEIAKEELAELKENGASQEEIALKALEVEKLTAALTQTQQLRDVEVKQKQREADTLRKETQNNKILAPYNGTVVHIADVSAGMSVKGYDPVLYLADDSRLSISAKYIQESELAGADRLYAQIGHKEYALEYLPYDSDDFIQMALSGVEMKSKFAFSAPDGGVESGQYAAVMLQRAYEANAITIPVNALYSSGGSHYVYVMENEQKVRRKITVGLITESKVQVTEGLQEGEQVYVKD